MVTDRIELWGFFDQVGVWLYRFGSFAQRRVDHRELPQQANVEALDVGRHRAA
jgi:hypothetical protein